MNEQSLFVAALEYETRAERQAFLDEVCTDLSMRKRVQRLLQSYEIAGDFLNEPAAASPESLFDSSVPVEEAGQQIGPYKLLEQVGEGGMGVVYMAAQLTPVRRKVALKIIKPGMDTKQVVARFEAERQALAMMDHPNIAHVLDAGTTESGRPYFVMELVRGIPLTDYCQREDLNLEQRLLLFIDVCHAVQHAHLKGIIHRDIKPSNVMVTLHDGTPVVKMIDFGVAKAMNQQLTDRTLFTNFSHMIGTPLYMSPEQAEMSGLDVDIRSDIYSLGVLLYELLTDTTPFEKERLREAGYDEMRRIIREEEPPRPSTRLSTLQHRSATVSDRRKTDVRKLSQSLRGELDWIVVRALEKNRSRRYQNAKEFAEDVQRFLNGEPVEACPPSIAYRVRKVLWRHRTAAVTIGVTAIILLASTAVSTVFAFRAREARQEAAEARTVAETEAAIANSISNFLSDEVLGQASPYVDPDRNLKLRDVLDRASEKIEGQFADQPLVEARIRMTIGTTYLHLGEFGTAEMHIRRASELRHRILGKIDRSTLQSDFQLGLIDLYVRGDKQAQETWETTLRHQQDVLGEADKDTLLTLDWLAYCYALQRKFDLAEPLFRKAIDGMRKTQGPEHPLTLDCLDGLARMFSYQERYEEAEELQQQLLDVRRRVLGVNHPQYIDSLSALADLHMLRGKNEEALALYEEVVASRKRVEGASHPATLHDTRGMASAFQVLHQFDKAEQAYLEALQVERNQFGDDDERTLWTMRRLASLYRTQGRYAESVRIYQSILDSRRRTLGASHASAVAAMRQLSSVLVSAERYDEATALHQEIVDVQAAVFGADHDTTTVARLVMAHGQQEAGRYQEAERICVQLLQRQTELHGRKHATTMDCMRLLAFTCKKSRRLAEAEQLFRELWQISPEVLGRVHPETLRAGNQLATVLRFLNRPDEAEPICREVLQLRLETFGEEHLDTIYSLQELVHLCEASGRLDEAVELQKRIVRTYRKINGDQHPSTIAEIEDLAACLARYEEAGDADAAMSLTDDLRKLVGELDPGTGGTPPSSRLRHAGLMLRFGHEEGARSLCHALANQLLSGADSRDLEHTQDALRKLLEFYHAADWSEDAADLMRRTLAVLDGVSIKDDNLATNFATGVLSELQASKRWKAARTLSETIVGRLTERNGSSAPATHQARHTLGVILREQENWQDAEAVFRDLYQTAPVVFGPEAEETLAAGHQLAQLYRLQGRFAEAETLARTNLTVRERLYGDLDRRTLESVTLLAQVALEQQHLDEAAALLERTVRILTAMGTSEPSHISNTLHQLNAIAVVYQRTGHLDRSADLCRRLSDLTSATYGEKSLQTVNALATAARITKEAGDLDVAIQLRTKELALRRDPAVQQHAPVICMYLLAETLVAARRLDEAEPLLRESLKLWVDKDPTDIEQCLPALLLGSILIHRQAYEEAESLLLQCEEITSRHPSAGKLHGAAVQRLAKLYTVAQLPESAAPWIELSQQQHQPPPQQQQ